MMQCTWIDCTAEATRPQESVDGSVWAELCPAHDKELSDAFDKGPKAILSTWVKAQGGAAKAADRMISFGVISR